MSGVRFGTISVRAVKEAITRTISFAQRQRKGFGLRRVSVARGAMVPSFNLEIGRSSPKEGKGKYEPKAGSVRVRGRNGMGQSMSSNVQNNDLKALKRKNSKCTEQHARVSQG